MNEARTLRSGDTVILHFRIAVPDGGEIDSTFGAEPATLTLGSGQLAEGLERCLLGLAPGERRAFRLEPREAFGESRPELVQTLPPGRFQGEVPPRPDSLIEFSLPGGETLAGTVKAVTPDGVVVDFNHPLSDCPILFEVEVLALRD